MLFSKITYPDRINLVKDTQSFNVRADKAIGDIEYKFDLSYLEQFINKTNNLHIGREQVTNRDSKVD